MSRSPTRNRLPAARRRARFRPALESLEDRCVPSVGTFDPATATWYLRNSNSPGGPDIAPFAYGGAGWDPVVGDWNGNGANGIGVFDPSTATWYLKNNPGVGVPDIKPFAYGGAGWIPVVGDWDGNGSSTVGVVDPTTMTWYLKNSNSPGAPDYMPFQYGEPGWIPVVGDWTGTGKTGIGVFDPSTATWYLKNSPSPGAPDITPFAYGGAGWQPVVGDWNGDAITTVGVVDPGGTWYIKNSNGPGAPDVPPFAYGAGSWTAVTLSSLPFDLLRGSTAFTGTYPAPATVTFTDSTGQKQQVLAIPGQVQVFFNSTTSEPDAAAVIAANGGSVLAQIPNVGSYLVGVPAGQEGAFIARVAVDSRVAYAAPDVLAPLNDAAVNFDNFNPGFFPPSPGFPLGESHGQWTTQVTIDERGLGPTTPVGIQQVNIGPQGSPTGAIIINQGARAILQTINQYAHQNLFINLSANGNDAATKTPVLATLLDDIATVPEPVRHNLVLTISAGNDNASLDPILANLRSHSTVTPFGNVSWADVLDHNFLVATANHSRDPGAPTTSESPDFDVAVMTNPAAANGTSGAAPAADGRIQRVAFDLRDQHVNAYLALQGAKLAIAANTTGPHDLVIDEAKTAVGVLQAVMNAVPGATDLIAVQAAKQALTANANHKLVTAEAIAQAQLLVQAPPPPS
jgi:hypothetical protein